MTQLVPVESIVRKIVFLRGEKVLLDRDLSELYGVETKHLKRAVRRNIKRFPKDFMFELRKKELENLRSHFGTSSWGGTRYTPMAFTEQGVAMLSSVLNSDRAIEVNIAIMRAFVQLRKTLDSHAELARKLADLEQRLEGHDEQIQAIFDAIRQLITAPETKKKKIGFTVKEKQKVYGKRAKKQTARG
ncbi:MAG: ORF6N domain-containing protein [Pseudomonadota bacterium]|uniref:ORF6N domain-containing protein n=1 Tax=Candidatus Desulfatibia profunda TaxID=2841695 RepID=A0A8J6NWT2_9BACT|nr:ORF6N domain-containing protein [Candidatus Desulfatibia profunda]MBL7180106.1 ORF6N domain-containing protein [Desulfobacterales bacterium]